MPVFCRQGDLRVRPPGVAKSWQNTEILVSRRFLAAQAVVQLIDGFDGLPLARNPNVVEACAASDPL